MTTITHPVYPHHIKHLQTQIALIIVKAGGILNTHPFTIQLPFYEQQSFEIFMVAADSPVRLYAGAFAQQPGAAQKND